MMQWLLPAGLADKISGETFELQSKDDFGYTLREPLVGGLGMGSDLCAACHAELGKQNVLLARCFGTSNWSHGRL